MIHGTGDVSLDPDYIPAFRTNGYGWAWSGLDGLFRDDDLTVINHECPSTDIVAPLPKKFMFRCDPEALAGRGRGSRSRASRTTTGSTRARRGCWTPIRNVRRADIVAVGAGGTPRRRTRPPTSRSGVADRDRRGRRGARPDSQVADGDEPGTAVGHEFSRALRAIREAEANADLVIVVIHWGVELDTQPREYQVDEAHRMIDAGADVIFGHHAHRLQPMDTYEGRPIFYGLGNFVWPSFSVEGSTTAVAGVVVRPNGTIRGGSCPRTSVAGTSGPPLNR